MAQDGQVLISGGLGRAKALVSGSVTAESAGTVPGLADALRALTIVRYGRVEKVDGGDEALATGLRIAKQQASKHSVIAEWGRAFVDSLVDMRKKVWA